MLVFVVRHACAGWRSDWDGDDADRPLDEAGVAQAEALARVLAPRAPRRLASSPTRRCIETLVPLARQLGQPIEPIEALAPDAPLGDLLALLHRADADRAVLCTHGEVMGQLLGALRAEGLVVAEADTSDEALLAKGDGWALRWGEGRPHLARLAGVPARPCPHHR